MHAWTSNGSRARPAAGRSARRAIRDRARRATPSRSRRRPRRSRRNRRSAIVWRDFIDASVCASRRNRSRISAAYCGSCIASGRISLIAAWRASNRCRRAKPRPCRRCRASRRADSCRALVARASAVRVSRALDARPRAHAHEVPREHERDARPRWPARRALAITLERSSAWVGPSSVRSARPSRRYQSSGTVTPARLPPTGATDARYSPSLASGYRTLLARAIAPNAANSASSAESCRSSWRISVFADGSAY